MWKIVRAGSVGRDPLFEHRLLDPPHRLHLRDARVGHAIHMFGKQLLFVLGGELPVVRHPLIVVVRDQIENILPLKDEWYGVGNLFRCHVVVIHFEQADSAGSEASDRGRELEGDGVLAGSESLLAFPAEADVIGDVVGEDGLALEQVEPIPTEASAVGVEHAGRTVSGISTSADMVNERFRMLSG